MVLLQSIAAGLLVLVSALYAVWHLTPARGRRRLLGWMARTPGFSGRWIQWLRRESVQDGAGSAGGCSGCGAARVRTRSGARTRTPVAPRR